MKFNCGVRFGCCCLLFFLSGLAQASIAPVYGPPYAIPDRYVSTSYGATAGAAAAVWWEKYKKYWRVSPYGSLQCGYYITNETAGIFGRIGTVRLNGQCRGSDPINATVSCPVGYQLSVNICVEDAKAIEEKNTPDPCNSTSQPVNFSTGNKFIAETDLEPEGTQPLQFSRIWNSYNQKWLFSYRQYLTDVQTTLHTVSVYRDSGQVVRFNDVAGVWTPDADVRDRLVKDGSDWLYIMASGDKEWFDSAGKLLRIQYVDGGLITVTYPDTTAVNIADAYGNDIDLTLDIIGRVTAMVDPDNQAYRYAYTIDDNLEYVSYPDTTPGASGSNPFGEDNPVRRYHYGDSRNANLVTGITDENGALYKTIAYDVQGRATLSGLTDGSLGQSTLDYASINDSVDPTVTVTNSLGKDTVYHLDNLFGVSKVTQVEGVSSANCLADVQNKTYYSSTGWLERSYDKAGVATYYEYFTDAGRYGLLKQRIEAESTSVQRTFAFDWDASTRQITQEVIQGQRKADYTYHANGRLHTKTETDLTNGNTRVWTTTYTYHDPGTDTRVKTKAIDGPRAIADITRYEYSSQGYLASITNAVGHKTEYQNHNGRGQPGKIIDPNGRVTTLTYASRGWLDSITEDVGGSNAFTDFTYDAVGQLTRVTLPDATYVDYNYDDAHRLESITNSVGERVEYSLDAAGNPDLI